MKKLLALSFLSLASFALGQRTLPCVGNALITYASKDGLASGLDDAFSSLLVYYPASFPNKASTKFIPGPLTMKCPGYSVSSTRTSIRIDGPLPKTLNLITPPFRDGEFDPEIPTRKFVLAYAGRYIYPNIQEDWIQERLQLTLKNGRLNVVHDGDTYQVLFDDLVVGARVNGGPLRPVFFNDKVTQVAHDGNDLVEFFLRGEPTAFDYVAIDFGKSTITMRNGVPFPKK